MVAKRVLLVEDDDLLRELYEFKLDAEGFEVAATKHGQEALDQVDGFEPGIILLDMMMPVMDGMEFLKLYQPTTHPEVKVIVLSNKSTPNEVYDAKLLGIADYLIKSNFTPDDLVQALNQYLEDEAAQD